MKDKTVRYFRKMTNEDNYYLYKIVKGFVYCYSNNKHWIESYYHDNPHILYGDPWTFKEITEEEVFLELL